MRILVLLLATAAKHKLLLFRVIHDHKCCIPSKKLDKIFEYGIKLHLLICTLLTFDTMPYHTCDRVYKHLRTCIFVRPFVLYNWLDMDLAPHSVVSDDVMIRERFHSLTRVW